MKSRYASGNSSRISFTKKKCLGVFSSQREYSPDLDTRISMITLRTTAALPGFDAASRTNSVSSGEKWIPGFVANRLRISVGRSAHVGPRPDGLSTQ